MKIRLRRPTDYYEVNVPLRKTKTALFYYTCAVDFLSREDPGPPFSQTKVYRFFFPHYETAAEAKYAELKAAAEETEDPATPAGEKICSICGKSHVGSIFDKGIVFVQTASSVFSFRIRC